MLQCFNTISSIKILKWIVSTKSGIHLLHVLKQFLILLKVVSRDRAGIKLVARKL